MYRRRECYFRSWGQRGEADWGHGCYDFSRVHRRVVGRGRCAVALVVAKDRIVRTAGLGQQRIGVAVRTAEVAFVMRELAVEPEELQSVAARHTVQLMIRVSTVTVQNRDVRINGVYSLGLRL